MNKEQIHLRSLCVAAMKDTLKQELSGIGFLHTKRKILKYHMLVYFFPRDIEAHGCAGLTGAINRLCEDPESKMVKLHKGAGELAHYTFDKALLEQWIDEIEAEGGTGNE